MDNINEIEMFIKTKESNTIVETEEEKPSLIIDELHGKHKDYGLLRNVEMLLILIATMVVVQIILIIWKKRYLKSFQTITPIAVWVIPLIICIYLSYWMFIIIWTLFSFMTGLIVYKALERPLQGLTPRLVYKWFYFVYKLTYIFGIVGYMIMVVAFFEISESSWIICGWVIMYYGLYFGLLGQYVAEICASKMAVHLGYYSPQGIPTRNLDKNICAVCGNKLLVNAGEESIIESTFQLTCNHIFHEFCIRGWCIIGKKQTCPYCKEKVDLENMFISPWEKPHVLFSQLLDWLHWVLVWGPTLTIILYSLTFINI